MKISEILKAAKAKIENPENWGQEYYAYDKDRNMVLGNEEGAVCFCSLGAIEAVSGKVHCANGWPFKAESFLNLASGRTSIVAFNDDNGHEEVMAVWDKAIKMAEAEEGEAA